MLAKPVLSQIVEQVSGQGVTCAVASLPGHRSTMEDAHFLDLQPTYSAFGVFDGHAGLRCASHLAKSMPALIKDLGPPIAASTLESKWMAMDHDYVVNSAFGAGGSTAAVCVAVPDGSTFKVQVAHAGDTRVLVGTPDKSKVACKFATKDHKPDDKEERNRIVNAGGKVRAGRLTEDQVTVNVSRAFGDRDFKKGPGDAKSQKLIALPDVAQVDCQKGDIILICCDGVFEGGITNEEALWFVHERVQQGKELGMVMAEFSTWAVERGSKDNVTGLAAVLDTLTPTNTHDWKATPELFIPGPMSLPKDEGFMSAYRAIAMRAGLSLQAAIDKRKALASELLAQNLDKYGLAKGQPDYASWGEDVLRAIMRAKGKDVGSIADMAKTCKELAKKGEVVEPSAVVELREELTEKPVEAPSKAPAKKAEDSWGAEEEKEEEKAVVEEDGEGWSFGAEDGDSWEDM